VGVRLSGIIFEFSAEIVSKIIEEIGSAEKYVRIAIFQLHNEDVFKALSDRLKKNVRVDILTLPYDSINEDIRLQVESRFRELEEEGAKIYINRWNVGDPSRTTTAVGRWYSFHGKFIVTDKSAIALSANFIQGKELDAAIIFKGIAEKVNEFNEKFEKLLDLFVNRDNGSDGSIRRKIIETAGTDAKQIFELPKNITSIHKEHWIRHYPVKLCPSDTPVEEKLYLTPFDCRGRNLISNIIEEANNYAYISTESFTDDDFSNFLVRTAVNRKIDIRILTGAKSMDFTDRLESMFRDLAAQEIGVRTTEEDIHAKLLITDKALMVSSINLNKINLGFHPTSKFWRENSESIMICRRPEMIREAKELYVRIYEQSHDVTTRLAEKLGEMIKDMFAATFQLHFSPDARLLFAKFVLMKQLDIRKLIVKIGRITKKLMQHSNRSKVERQDFISALILYYLSERKQDLSQLKERIDEIDSNANLATIVSRLEFARFIEKEGDFYKINVESVIT
jgi:hypothetical protein